MEKAKKCWESVMATPSMKFVSRAKWNALPPKYTEPLNLPAERIFMTYTDTERCRSKTECIKSVQSLQKHYMDKGMPDIPYSFLVGGDLRIYEGRGWGVKIHWPEPHDWVEKWHDGRVVVAIICPENDNSEAAHKMVAKSYMLMYYGIDHKYLENFEEDSPGGSFNIDDETQVLKNEYERMKAAEKKKAEGIDEEEESSVEEEEGSSFSSFGEHSSDYEIKSDEEVHFDEDELLEIKRTDIHGSADKTKYDEDDTEEERGKEYFDFDKTKKFVQETENDIKDIHKSIDYIKEQMKEGGIGFDENKSVDIGKQMEATNTVKDNTTNTVKNKDEKKSTSAEEKGSGNRYKIKQGIEFNKSKSVNIDKITETTNTDKDNTTNTVKNKDERHSTSVEEKISENRDTSFFERSGSENESDIETTDSEKEIEERSSGDTSELWLRSDSEDSSDLDSDLERNEIGEGNIDSNGIHVKKEDDTEQTPKSDVRGKGMDKSHTDENKELFRSDEDKDDNLDKLRKRLLDSDESEESESTSETDASVISEEGTDIENLSEIEDMKEALYESL